MLGISAEGKATTKTDREQLYSTPDSHIFAWLDWDGTDSPTDAGIIDYSSVHQFSIRHDKYRYDDVERFSTRI